LTSSRDAQRAARISALAAAGARGFAWFDGGDSADGWLGVEPDEEVEADDLSVLADVERSWLATPEVPWLGWITYDVGADAVLGRACAPRGRLCGVGLRRYPAALRLLAGGGRRQVGDPDASRRLDARLDATPPRPAHGWPWSVLSADRSPASYRRMVEAGLGHIAAGDTYQLNLSQPFSASRHPDYDAGATSAELAADTYLHLRSVTPATMGALVDAGPAWIVSNSPETLLEVAYEGGAPVAAASMPIKGTRPRVLDDPSADAAQAAALQSSAKDRAEHVMIVDLVRNDLGRLAQPGTVVADPTPRLVSLPTVHHLITTVRARLRSPASLAELFAAMFPGGSITGAPKRRTVELIDGLEATPRGIYCGALLALHPQGVHVSIPIRTAVLDEARLCLRSGGGIVIDSDPETERLETIAKARAFDPRRMPTPPAQTKG